jgi:catechol 2,3-dioxygenase-like lactoylglutathione lyase family enzyme
MSTATVSAPVRFHISLNVAHLGRAVEFYHVLLGRGAAKCRADYAKFEMDDPPLVLSLEPNRKALGGALNHLGFRVPDSAALVAMQHRLESAGIQTQREEGVECCYARQTKFWVKDPDQNLWEVYVFEGDLDHRGIGHAPSAAASEPPPSAEPISWEHLLGQPIPDRIPLIEGTVDEVRLRGTFNVPLSAEQQRHIVTETFRILKPGGQVFLHQLVADRPLNGRAPRLPGPAAWVQHVPLEREPVQLLEACGFVALQLVKLGSTACFQQDGVEMRECQLTGRKPESNPAGPGGEVIYKGPFLQVTDDTGTFYRRGVRVRVNGAKLHQLQSGPLAEAFTFVVSGAGKSCAG